MGEPVSYTATSSDQGVVSVSLSGSNLTVTAVAAGTATVTATDPDGLTAAQSANITVEAANQAPEAVGVIPPQVMTAGQSVTLDVSSFFTDPDGDELTYTAVSSNADAVTVNLEGSRLTVTAVAEGSATVTVTASDPDRLSATLGSEGHGRGRQPGSGARGHRPPRTMGVGSEVVVNMFRFFHDPDGDELTYEAESSNPDIVSVGVSGSTLTITAVAAGAAELTVTVTDPGGLSAFQNADITVTSGAGSFREDFDTAASLDTWVIFNADVAVVEGVLRVINTMSDLLGSADHTIDPTLGMWRIRARMGQRTTDALPAVYWVTGHSRFSLVGFVLGALFPDGRNYSFIIRDEDENSLFRLRDFSGTSEAINSNPDAFTDLTIGHDNGDFVAQAGDTELFRGTIEGFGVDGVPFGEFLNHVSEIWLANLGDPGSTTLYDWVEVTGEESSMDASHEGTSGRNPDLATDALEAAAVRSIHLDRSTGTRGGRRDP